MSMGEIIIILIVAVLVLGPEKLPSTAVQIAKILKALKRQVDDAKESIEKEIRVSEIKKEADKYKNEFSEYNQNIRKKLSFEEFDELKKEIVADTNAIKDDINAIEKDLASLGKEQNAENSVNLNEKSVQNSASTAKIAENLANSSENSAQNSLNSKSTTQNSSENSAQSVASKANKSAKTATKAQTNIKAQENASQASAKVQTKTKTNTAKAHEKANAKIKTAKKPKTKIEQDNV